MLNTVTRNTKALERQAEQLYCIIAASEPWATSYTKDTESHAAIIKHEAKLERVFRRYFKDLTERVQTYILWDNYKNQTLQAYDVNVTVNDDAFDGEDGILINLTTDLTATGVAIGAQAGEGIYNTPLGLDTYSETVQTTARHQTSKLVTQINAATRNYIQTSLDTSIRLGETTDQAAARINKRIGNPSRAATIARTESVTSYQLGMLTFGRASGAIGREWQSTSGACEICGPLDGRIVRIDDNFNSEVGANPPAHPNCRCGQRLIYQNELDNNSELFTPPEAGISLDTSKPKPKAAPQPLKFTLSHQGIEHSIPITKGEAKFIKDSGLDIEMDTSNTILKKNVLGMYRPRVHTMFVKPPGKKMDKDYNKTFIHELGHAIDYKLLDGTLSDSHAASAIVSDKLAVAKARVMRMLPDLPEADALHYAKGRPWIIKTDANGTKYKVGMGPKYVKYIRKETEVFADGYAQWRLDPIAFAKYAPELTKIYEGLKI